MLRPATGLTFGETGVVWEFQAVTSETGMLMFEIGFGGVISWDQLCPSVRGSESGQGCTFVVRVWREEKVIVEEQVLAM